MEYRADALNWVESRGLEEPRFDIGDYMPLREHFKGPLDISLFWHTLHNGWAFGLAGELNRLHRVQPAIRQHARLVLIAVTLAGVGLLVK